VDKWKKKEWMNVWNRLWNCASLYCAVQCRHHNIPVEILNWNTCFRVTYYVLLQIEGHDDDVNTVAFADNTSQILYSGGDDGLCKVPVLTMCSKLLAGWREDVLLTQSNREHKNCRLLRRFVHVCEHAHAHTCPTVIQGGSNMTGTDVTRFTHKSFPVIFEPPCINSQLVATVIIISTISISSTCFGR